MGLTPHARLGTWCWDLVTECARLARKPCATTARTIESRLFSGCVEFRNSVRRREGQQPLVLDAREAVLHHVGVFVGVVVMAAQDAHRAKTLVAEEELCVEVRLADFDHDLATALLREFVDQPADHLSADALAAHVRDRGKVEHAQLRLVQLVDHEADDAVIVLGHHADAVALPQTAQEVFLGPRVIEGGALDGEHIVHIAPDEPADLNFQFLFRNFFLAHEGLLAVFFPALVVLKAGDSLPIRKARGGYHSGRPPGRELWVLGRALRTDPRRTKACSPREAIRVMSTCSRTSRCSRLSVIARDFDIPEFVAACGLDQWVAFETSETKKSFARPNSRFIKATRARVAFRSKILGQLGRFSSCRRFKHLYSTVPTFICHSEPQRISQNLPALLGDARHSAAA